MLKEHRKVAKVQEDYINYVEPKEDEPEIKTEVAMDEWRRLSSLISQFSSKLRQLSFEFYKKIYNVK